jgi:hypothetical protein
LLQGKYDARLDLCTQEKLKIYLHFFSFFCLPKRKKQRKEQPKTKAPLFLAGQRT